ncbi:GNAT family N-acetyltransferase [Pseudovibrio sp. JE062]|uniref:GNAT family N-acetyltransferase n=1 Tax=Pseudovibrio sp. JE062 TaxID=439495 RepID=UPI000186B640|nr:N-acetyltransferase [Pseudovibrio sp. JE062]EEA92304.1 acetyltransferase, gnat family [Pseudovibrio sp. JE062]
MVEVQQFGVDQVDLRGPEKKDEPAILSLLVRAFGQSNEGRLVERLRGCGALVLERIATDTDGNLLGHLAFSRVTGTGEGHRLKISCLAPVCVEPAAKNKGVGTKLIQAALDELQGLGEDLVLVLGAPDYFNRFGFDNELAKKVQGPYAGPIFMALPFTQAGREELPVEVTYATPFQEFE